MASDFYVYVLFRPWNGTPFYVGKGSKGRFGWHRRAVARQRNDRTGKILRKADELGLEIPAVKIREGMDEREAHSLEVALISALGRDADGLLANLTDGGEGTSGIVRTSAHNEKVRTALSGNKNSLGTKRSPDTIEKLRAAQSQRSAATIEKLRAANLGKKLSDEHRAKLSQAKKGKKQAAAHVESRASANRGKTRSAKARANLSAGQVGNKNGIGRVVSPEVRAKIAAATKARWENPEGRRRLLASMGLV